MSFMPAVAAVLESAAIPFERDFTKPWTIFAVGTLSFSWTISIARMRLT